MRRHSDRVGVLAGYRASVVLVWCGTCAACGAPFTVKTPQRLEGTKAFGRKHCDMHKLKGGRNEC